MTRVVMDLEQEQNYKPGESEIIILGTTDQIRPIAEYSRYSDILGIDDSIVPMGIYSDSYQCYRLYLNYVLSNPAVFCSVEESTKISKSQEYASMPSFPQTGYIDEIDDIFVVKLGN